MSTDRIEKIKEKLSDEDLNSHQRDQLKRELNKLQAKENGDGASGIHRTVGIALLAVLFVGGIGYVLASTGVIQFSVSEPSGGNVINMSQISLEGEPVKGDPDAPVTMVAYEDFQCPVCQRFDGAVMDRLVSDYVESGELKVVWKDMPLSQIHDWAATAAATQECVYRQDNDAFWAVKDKIFDNQGSLTVTNVQSKIIQWASEEGVSGDAVRACLQNENPMQEVQSDYGEGRNMGVSGTPTVFIDGVRLSGLNPYSRYQQLIEQATN